MMICSRCKSESVLGGVIGKRWYCWACWLGW